ncbi:MAG: ABC transporter substrate-binding protein [Alphaproteobacteria bacterium]|nr:ABC transporter substrate-binding protein [Alphaproteobacteria bacterium]
MKGPRLPSRRSLIKGSAAIGAIGALQLASPFIISARGEVPLRIGMIDPLSGSYAAVARSEVEGAKLGVAEVNAKGGILGRQVELLVEDSANDVGTGVQKAHKLFERDHVDVLFGDVNSAIALALAQVSSAAGKLHIVTGGHTDGITGKDCHWNVFRVCNTTYMDADAVTQVLVDKLGKKWFFLTPDYAYGHTLQAAFVKLLTKLGGTYEAALAPIGTNDYSAYLIKARASGAKVLIDLMGGGDQVVSIKQFTQFGLNKQMALGGALFELESIQALPANARTGWWTMEWYWNQPGVPHVAEFVANIRKGTGKTASARHWFGYVAVRSVQLAAERAKSVDGVKMARAMEGMTLPPDVALMPGTFGYRAGDHQLMSSVMVGEARNPPPGDNPDDLFKVTALVPGEKAALPVDESGCTLRYPA